jgi:hypothetical protein
MPNDETSRTWWQTVPGMITAFAGLLTAIGGLLTILLQAGIIGPDGRSRAEATRAAPASPGPTAIAERSERPPADLEAGLERANIQLGIGTAEHIAQVRGYISAPDGAYARLADACLDVLAGRRLKRRGYLDMIDKWYTSVIGGENRYLSETGDIRRSELMDAMVKAANEIDGTQATSFDEIVEGVQR